MESIRYTAINAVKSFFVGRNHAIAINDKTPTVRIRVLMFSDDFYRCKHRMIDMVRDHGGLLSYKLDSIGSELFYRIEIMI